MAGGNRGEPRCGNSWRPSDGPLSPQSGLPQRRQSPVPHERPGQFAAQTLYSGSICSKPPLHTFKNPNLIPVMPRWSQSAASSSPIANPGHHEETGEERLPQIWHTSIDDLIRRTTHDYDLVLNYERDAEGGQRWLPADVAHIRNVGTNLHRDIFALRRWQRVVARQGDQDKVLMIHIKREANFVKLLCERVQSAIARCEQKCNFELLRDGAYAQDEDGNLYKPTTSQEILAEGGYHDDVSRPRHESIENGSCEHNQDYNQDKYTDYGGAAALGMPPGNEVPSPSRRSLAFDSTSQSTPSARMNREAAQHTSEQTPERSTSSRCGRLVDGKISKPYPSSSKHKHRSLSPDHPGRSPYSKRSVQGEENYKARSRGKTNAYDRNGLSRRQVKMNRAQPRSPPTTIGRLGKHKLHY